MLNGEWTELYDPFNTSRPDPYTGRLPRPAPGPPGRPGLYAALELDRPLVAVDPRWTFRSGARPRPRAPVTPRRAPAPASRLPPRLDARTRRRRRGNG